MLLGNVDSMRNRFLETLKTVASIVGPIIGLASLIAAFFFYRKSRKYMELTYEILPTLSLVSVGQAVKGKVEIKFGNEQIEDLEGVAVLIRSTGTEAVEFNQYTGSSTVATQTPVTLDFGEGARILGEPTVVTDPEGIRASAIKDPQDPSKVVLDKFLLNSGESVTISVILTNFTRTKPNLYAHIKGVPPLRELGPDRRIVTQQAVFLLLLVGGGLGSVLTSVLLGEGWYSGLSDIRNIAGTLVMVAVIIGALQLVREGLKAFERR